MPILSPPDAVVLLRQRCGRLEVELVQNAAVRDLAINRELPRLFLIEAEFRANQRAAELDFVRALVKEIEDGTFDGLAQWRAFHQRRDEPGTVLAIGEAKGRRG